MGRIHDDVDHFSRFTYKAVEDLNKDGDAQAAEAMQLELRYHVRRDLKLSPMRTTTALACCRLTQTDSDRQPQQKGNIQALRDISSDLVRGDFRSMSRPNPSCRSFLLDAFECR